VPALLPPGQLLLRAAQVPGWPPYRRLPDLIAAELGSYLDSLPDGAPLVFTSPSGMPLAHSNFRRRVWLPALKTAGLSRVHFHFHDLRHTGNQLIANAGANPRELMARMGHDSSRAALITCTGPPTGSAPWPRRWATAPAPNSPSPSARRPANLARECMAKSAH
jgi:hypothetical protein